MSKLDWYEFKASWNERSPLEKSGLVVFALTILLLVFVLASRLLA